MHLSEVTSYKIHTLRGCNTYSSLYPYTHTAPHFCHYAPLNYSLKVNAIYINSYAKKLPHGFVYYCNDFHGLHPFTEYKTWEQIFPCQGWYNRWILPIFSSMMTNMVVDLPIFTCFYVLPGWMIFFLNFQIKFFQFFQIKFRYEKW